MKSVNYFFRMGGNSFKDGSLGLKECKNVAISFGGNKYIIYYHFLIDYFKFVLKYEILRFKV